jgi:hypothetical protein
VRTLAVLRLRPLLFAGLAVLAGVATAADAVPQLSGTWKPARSLDAGVRTSDGKAPPLTAQGRAAQEARAAALKKGNDEDPVTRCLRPGTPRILFQGTPFLLLQTPRKVTFVHQFQHVLRHVPLGAPLPPADDLEPTWGGIAAGRFAGHTLVVETSGFHDVLWMDRTGLPQSPNARITERLRLVDRNTLEDVVTIDDAANYTKPWTVTLRYQRADGTELKEDICAEKLLDPALKKNILERK